MAGLFSSLKNLADGFFMEEEDTDDLPEDCDTPTRTTV